MNTLLNIRVWDTEYKHWRELPDLYGAYQANAYRTYGEPFSIARFFNSDVQDGIVEGTIIVQQSIGMIDKNGKEIFEGDIIKYNKRGGIMSNDADYEDVVLLKGKPKLAYFSKEQHPINGWSFLYNTFEVIGNIFENPVN